MSDQINEEAFPAAKKNEGGIRLSTQYSGGPIYNTAINEPTKWVYVRGILMEKPIDWEEEEEE